MGDPGCLRRDARETLTSSSAMRFVGCGVGEAVVNGPVGKITLPRPPPADTLRCRARDAAAVGVAVCVVVRVTSSVIGVGVVMGTVAVGRVVVDVGAIVESSVESSPEG